MKKTASKKPLWAQNSGQSIGRKTRKSSSKNPQITLFDVETYGDMVNPSIHVAVSKPGKTNMLVSKMIDIAQATNKTKPSWATGRDQNYIDEAYQNIVVDRDPEESLREAEKRFAAAIQEADARLQRFREKYTKPVHTSGYVSVVPDSHFWADLDMLTNWAKYMPESNEKHHLLKGLKNTQAQGYQLVQLGKEHAKPVNGTFAKHYDYLRTERIAMSQAEFVKTFLNFKPTKIFCNSWSTVKPLYTILAHYDFMQTRARKQTPSVRIQAAFEDTPRRVYLPAFYKVLTTENQHRMPFTSLTFK